MAPPAAPPSVSAAPPLVPTTSLNPVTAPAETPVGTLPEALPLTAPSTDHHASLKEDDVTYEYEDDEELDENAPEADLGPRRLSRPRLQTARINPAALTMLSGALKLLTPATPPSEPTPTLSRTRISTESLLLFSTDPAAPPPDV